MDTGAPTWSIRFDACGWGGTHVDHVAVDPEVRLAAVLLLQEQKRAAHCVVVQLEQRRQLADADGGVQLQVRPHGREHGLRLHLHSNRNKVSSNLPQAVLRTTSALRRHQCRSTCSSVGSALEMALKPARRWRMLTGSPAR
jgi:hypothetical protein